MLSPDQHCLQRLFAAPLPPLFQGNLLQGRWWQGELLQGERTVARVSDGVIDFTFGADFWPKAQLRALDQHQSIANNWRGEWAHTLCSAARQRLCELAMEAGGPILELAAGPGGGNLSPLLHHSPEATIIVNDLESRLLTRWQSWLSDNHLGSNVVFAAFDACQMPLRDSQIACISGVGALGSLLGDNLQALKECRRVLQPHGWLLLSEMVLTPMSLASLPDGLRSNWSNLAWLMGRGHQLLQQAGFCIREHHVEAGRPLTLDQDGLAEEAAEYCVGI
jgi:SAM-dependent methyltransferase